jgi:hypothetical protein
MPVILGGNTGIYLASLTPPAPIIPIVTTNLILNLDAGNPVSYPGSGTTWFDLSGNNYHHTLVNGVGYDSADGGSLDFDGSDTFVTKNYVAGDKYDLSLTGKMTIDIWINWNQLFRSLDGGVAFGWIFGNASAGHMQWQFFKHISGSATRFRFGVMNTSVELNYDQVIGGGTFNPVTPITANTWFNFTYTYDKATGVITGYVNGQLAGGTTSGTNPASFALPTTTARVTSVGGSALSGGLYSMLGKLGILRLYDRDLTASEVLQNFNASRTRFGI